MTDATGTRVVASVSWFGWLGMGHETGQDVMIGAVALWVVFAQIRRMVGRDDD